MAIFLLGSVAGLLILGIPLLWRRLDLFEPLTLFILVYLLGGVVESFRLVIDNNTWGYPLGITEKTLLLVQIYTLVGLVCFQAGYSAGFVNKVFRKIPTISYKTLNNRLLWFCTVLVALLGFWSLYELYLRLSINYIELTTFSGKRSVTNNYLRWGAKLVGVSFCLSFFLYLKEKFSIVSFKFVFLFITLTLYSAYCFVFSIRGSLLTALFICIITYHYSERRVGTLLLLAVLVPIAGLFGFMGLVRIPYKLRSSSEGILDVVVEKLFGLSSMYDITTFSLIVKNTPETFDYQLGSTLINWVVFPIPRSMWASKPINLGQRIGEEIYHVGIGKMGGGVPPPFIAELYLNFHILGIIVGMFILGLITKSAYKSVIYRGSNLCHIFIYAVCLRFFFVLFRADLTLTIVSSLKWFVPILVVFLVSNGGRFVVSPKPM